MRLKGLVLVLSGFAQAHPGDVTPEAWAVENRSDARMQDNGAIRYAWQSQGHWVPTYNREDWPHWEDLNDDCQNTRHEMLILYAEPGSLKLSPDGCYVSRGEWYDPYSAKTFYRASELDVDHLVPLYWAHRHGGANWSTAKKRAFANDPQNLLVVDDGLNQAKGAKGPDEWMPPNHAFRCQYLKLWLEVLAKYPDLKFYAREQRVVNRQRKACGIGG